MRDDEISLTPTKEKGSPGILNQTKARFDAVLRAAVRKSDNVKLNLNHSPLKKSHDENLSDAYSSQHNLIEELSEKEEPAVELFYQKKTRYKPSRVSETSFSTPSKHSHKSSRKSLNFGSPTTKNSLFQNQHYIESRNESNDLEENLSSGSNEIQEIGQQYETGGAQHEDLMTVPFSQDNSESQPGDEPIVKRPTPLPRRFSLKYDEDTEVIPPTPMPRSRSLYGNKSTDDDSRSEVNTEATQNNIKRVEEHLPQSPKTIKDPSRTGDFDGKIFKTFSREELTKKPDRQVVEGLKLRAKSKSTDHRHKHERRRHTEVQEIEMMPIKKTKTKKKNEKSVHGASKRKTIKPEEIINSNIVGVYVHNLSWLGHAFSKTVLIKPYIRVSLYQTNRGQRPLHSPLSSKTYSCFGKDITPKWEELMVFPIDYKMVEDKLSIIFFEIFDIKIGFRRSLDAEYCLAWAFLKPIGVNGMNNTHTKIQLQLYKPRPLPKERDIAPVYQWWAVERRKKFPGTLYVTIKSLPVEQPEEEPIMEEQLIVESRLEEYEKIAIYDEPEIPSWIRIPGQSCKLPNSVLVKLPATPKGCLTVRFSATGDLLACACAETFDIQVYHMPEGDLRFQLTGHQGLVYDLCWTTDDGRLFSASSDRTVCVWDMSGDGRLLQFLPHPSFVYSCDVTLDSKLAVSGCYDRVVRLWSLRPCLTSGPNQDSYELHQELLEGHKGYVTAVCFGSVGKQVYSADSLGIVNEWSRRSGDQWQWTRKMCSVLGAVVNKLCIHPAGRRLLIHARDNALRILDIQNGAVTQTLKGAINSRIQTSACFSPCGGLVLAGGEDGLLTVWDADSGHRVAVYRPPWVPVNIAGMDKTAIISTIAAVDYHPQGHALAFCAYGFRTGVHVYRYKRDAQNCDVGLTEFLQRGKSMDLTCSQSETSIPFMKSLNDKGDNKAIRKRPSTSVVPFNKPKNESTDIVPNSAKTTEEGIKLSNLIKKIDLILNPVRKARVKPPPPAELLDNRFINILSELKSNRKAPVPYDETCEPLNEIVIVNEQEHEQLASISSQGTYVVKTRFDEEGSQHNKQTTMSEDSLMSSKLNDNSSTCLSDEDTKTSENRIRSWDRPYNRTYSISTHDEDLAQTSSFADSLTTDPPSSHLESPRARRRRQMDSLVNVKEYSGRKQNR